MANEQLLSSPQSPQSPQRSATVSIFSDELTRFSSPPSSPIDTSLPPTKQPKTPVKPQPPARNAFSVLGKRPALQPLSDTNARHTKRARTTPTTITATAEPRNQDKIQMQLSCGQQMQKRCRVCGMEFVPSSEQDRKMHAAFHRKATATGYELGKEFVGKLKLERPRSVYAGAKEGDAVCVVGADDGRARRKCVGDVLGIVTSELGAVEIGAQELWSRCPGDESKSRFVSLMYVREGICVAFLLAERIRSARRVKEPRMNKECDKVTATGAGALLALRAKREALAQAIKGPLQLSTRVFPANLGISRIWTSASHRGQGIARHLLDIALEYCGQNWSTQTVEHARQYEVVDGGESLQHVTTKDSQSVEIDKTLVAFSQPTEAGAKLARQWFGQLWGWGVYVE